MIISVINHSKLGDTTVLETIRAINRQISEDFEPYWSFGATLRLEGKSQNQPNTKTLADMRGDAVLYLWDEIDVDDALGYHDLNYRGISYGFVFRKLSDQLKENWTVTFSHEALELIGDPESNLLVAGPHPKDEKKEVFHWYEMCDAVQAETYKIDGIEVSNFVLPLYFTLNEEKGGRNDFLNHKHAGAALKSFGINAGGYVGFYDPATRKHETVDADDKARKRREIKSQAGLARRGIRYQQPYLPGVRTRLARKAKA
jgi:hypothetical protein